MTTPMLARPAPTPPPEPLSPTDVVSFLRRSWRVITGLAVVGAAGVGAYEAFLAEPDYTTSSLIAVVPPMYSSTLVPPGAITVRGYQQILESPEILLEAKRRLIAARLVDPEQALEIGDNVDTEIFVSKKADDKVLSATVAIRASAPTSAAAAAIANTWAEVFIERTRTLMSNAASTTIRLIEEQFPAARGQLDGLEDERFRVASDFERRRSEATSGWERKITAARQAAADRLAAYQDETRRLVDALVIGDLRARQAAIAPGSPLHARLLQLAAVRWQLAQTEPVVDLVRSLADEEVVGALVLASDDETATPAQSVAALQLRSEEVNPEYAELSLKAGELEVDLRGSAGASEPAVLELAAALESLQRKRSAGLARLRQSSRLEVDQLGRQRDEALALLRIEEANVLGQLRRRIEQLATLDKDLATNYNQAVIARAQEEIEEVRLAVRAAPPDQPEDRYVHVRILLGALAGAVLGFAVALTRELAEETPR